MALLGIPISLIFIWATKFAYLGFGESVWPGRLIGFAMGILSFSILTYFHLGEAFTLKTFITLILSVIIVLIQTLWR